MHEKKCQLEQIMNREEISITFDVQSNNSFLQYFVLKCGEMPSVALMLFNIQITILPLHNTYISMFLVQDR